MGFMPLLIYFDAPIMHQGCLLPHLAAIHNIKLGTNLQFFKYVVKFQFFALKRAFNYSRANLFSAEPQHLLTIKFDSGGIRGHIGDGPNFFRSRKYIYSQKLLEVK